MSESSSLAQIDYAPLPPWHRRRWWRWAVLLVVIASIPAAWRYALPAWRQVRVLYWQRQCMNFLQPADQFVYEEDPTTINVLAAKGRGYGLYRPPTGPGQFQNRMSNGPAPAAAVFVPRCWTALHALLPPAYLGGADGAVLFLHEMTSKNGARRLVVVTHAPSPDPQVFVLGFDVDAVVITPASGLTTPAAPLPMMYAIDVVIGLNQPPQKLRIYPGQIDPADPSHFTIRYEQWGQTDVMDGQLDSTGSRVEFTCRNHPSPRPRGAVSGGH